MLYAAYEINKYGLIDVMNLKYKSFCTCVENLLKLTYFSDKEIISRSIILKEF